MSSPTYEEMINFLTSEETRRRYAKVRDRVSLFLKCQDCFSENQLQTNPGFFETLSKKTLENKYNYIRRVFSVFPEEN